ncbi:hypothetical protein AMTR_s04453p00005220 [Amborella trichopoda]|uniref:Uncharacterized protein n=1 Tax=Amborella trichopoda TaxID=13333 RepID=U5CKH7_AMBTC|nr:hypothetical protein AMTR_s04453p00005220 [Amborella trichopoda]
MSCAENIFTITPPEPSETLVSDTVAAHSSSPTRFLSDSTDADFPPLSRSPSKSKSPQYPVNGGQVNMQPMVILQRNPNQPVQPNVHAMGTNPNPDFVKPMQPMDINPNSSLMASSWAARVAQTGPVRTSFKFHAPEVVGERIRVKPPPDIAKRGSTRWRDCLVGYFVEKRLAYPEFHCS